MANRKDRYLCVFYLLFVQWISMSVQHVNQQQQQFQQFQQPPAPPVPVQQQYQQQPGQPVPQEQQYQQPGQPVQQQQYQQQGQPVPQQQQQPGDQVNPNDPNQGHKFADDKEIHDQQHIKSHLEGQVNVEQQMTNEQLQFHYFKMHDSNNDNMLDGIELIKAITHWHGGNLTTDFVIRYHLGEVKDIDEKVAPPKMSDLELEDMIDQILKDDDFNNDGFIDYSEFLKAQAGRT